MFRITPSFLSAARHVAGRILSGRRLLGVLLLMAVGTAPLGACQRNLFVDTDPAAHKAERYFESDSAVKTREARRQGNEIGFGYSNGAAPQ